MAALCRYASGCPVCRDSLGLGRSLTHHYRRRFCTGDVRECARHAVAAEVGPGEVPDSLLPTDHTDAYELVSERWLRRGSAPEALVFSSH